MTDYDEARILAISAPALLPIIRRRQEQSLSRLLGFFRSGLTDLSPAVAEYAAFTELLREIELKISKHNEGE